MYMLLHAYLIVSIIASLSLWIILVRLTSNKYEVFAISITSLLFGFFWIVVLILLPLALLTVNIIDKCNDVN